MPNTPSLDTLGADSTCCAVAVCRARERTGSAGFKRYVPHWRDSSVKHGRAPLHEEKKL